MIDIDKLLKRYSRLHLKDKIHIFVRVLTVPWELILKSFPQANTIIDIGCGHGLLINLLAMRNNGFGKIIGIDPAVNKINIAKQTENHRIFFYALDAFNIKDRADIYSIIDALYLIPFGVQDKIIKHIYNNLPKGGYLILKEINKKPLWKFIVILLQETITVNILHLTHGQHFYFRKEDEFKKILSETGFNVVVNKIDKGYPYPHILYICQK